MEQTSTEANSNSNSSPSPSPSPIVMGLDDDYKEDTIIISNYVQVENTPPPAYGVTAEVPKLLAIKLSGFFQTCTELDKECDKINVLCSSAFNPRIFKYVVEYINMHINNESIKEIAKPLKSNDLAQVIGFDLADEQRKQFITKLADFINNIHFIDLFAVLNLANYLDMPTLLDIISARIAIYIKNKSEEEIKTLFEKSREEHQVMFSTDDEYKNKTFNSEVTPMDVDSGPEQKHED